MSIIKKISTLALAVAAISLSAETRCPGNVASVPYRVANRHQMIVTISLNDRGPYSFLFDTGTQITIVDRNLAAELGLSSQGRAAIVSAEVNASASVATIERMALGAQEVSGLDVIVYDLKNLRTEALDVRGVLGEDFLERFDMFIDNAHNLLCLDASGAMRAGMKGQRVSLLAPGPSSDGTLPKSLIVSAQLSDGLRPVRLKLDSGANVSFLYHTSEYLALGAFRGTPLSAGGVDGVQRIVTALPPQDMRIGHLVMPKVPFVTLEGARKDTHTSEFDGLLSMGLFSRIFINHADHFAILEP
jgi:hypothetical protein